MKWLSLSLVVISVAAACGDDTTPASTGGGGSSTLASTTTGTGAGGGGGTAQGGGGDGGGGDGGGCVDPGPLPEGALSRSAENPMLLNGPEEYDFDKTGPRVVLKIGPGDYRVWYEAVNQGNTLTTVALATSIDGVTYSKQGVVMAPSSAWEGNEISPNTILVEGSVYRLYYHAGGNALPNRNIGTATSADGGMSWTRHPTPVLSVGDSGAFDDDEVAEPRVFKIGNGYRMYYTGKSLTSGKTALGLAESTDGIVWTKSALSPLLQGDDWGNFWGGAFIRQPGRWLLWHGKEAGVGSSIHFKWSTDGITWIDGANNPVLSQNPDPDAPDAGLVGDSVSGYQDGDTYRVMYTGFNTNLFGSLGRFEGVCLASTTVDLPCPP
jgi:predicted GH43/DUF377 family glycosyl hydrolase